jgi:catechol 2,3-dioxygenase-like lactoylglutathione lyase family enzyme
MNNFRGLAHIGIHTDNTEESKKFYTENLGFKYIGEAVLDKPGNQHVKLTFIELNGMIIELVEPSEKKSGSAGSGAITHIAIEVNNLPDVVNNMKSKGIVFEAEEPRINDKIFNGVRVIFLSGPSGERIELLEYLG